jgi:hypothetical protein
MHRFTYFLLVLVVTTFGVTVARHARSISPGDQDTPKTDRFKEAKKDFPTAQYDQAEPDLADPAKNEARKEKQKRHDDFQFVARHPQPWQEESVFIPEGNFDFPALPVTQSELIVVGRVGKSSAHLSERKFNVYSEFDVIVQKALKAPDTGMLDGTQITVERVGGKVKYANGQTVLFRVSGWNMPKAGSDYLFFLKSASKRDWEIVTAYELTDRGVVPLDESSQFEAIKGTSSEDIFRQLRDLISQPSSK